MTIKDVREILRQGKSVRTVKSIYFEGGEPFLYYPVMLKGVQMAAQMGFKVGLLSNGYWGTNVEDAVEWLRPFKGIVQGVSISTDLYHYSEKFSRQAKNAEAAAKKLGIPIGFLQIAQPDAMKVAKTVGQLPEGESAVMYRGRAVEKLTKDAIKKPWTEFIECPYENLRDPGRVHVDPMGNMHICQGISVGNMLKTPLSKICKNYDPDRDPIIGPLLKGGPVELVKQYKLPHKNEYADACHMCYEARLALREKFPKILTPNQMYGIFG